VHVGCDTTAAGVLHAALLRSPYAHARIRSVLVDRARGMPGVVAVVTGTDLLEGVSPLPTNWVRPACRCRHLDSWSARSCEQGGMWWT
jgi:aerobic carbon-monoxide dehydrogenase large subunit